MGGRSKREDEGILLHGSKGERSAKFLFLRTKWGWHQIFLEGDDEMKRSLHTYVCGETIGALREWWKSDFDEHTSLAVKLTPELQRRVRQVRIRTY